MLDKDASRRPTAAEVTMAMDTALGTALRVPPAADMPKRHSVGRLRARADLHAAPEYVSRATRAAALRVGRARNR